MYYALNTDKEVLKTKFGNTCRVLPGRVASVIAIYSGKVKVLAIQSRGYII